MCNFVSVATRASRAGHRTSFVMWPTPEKIEAYYESFRPDPHRLATVKAAIARDGRWEERFEWRISTDLLSVIERSEINGQKAFRVAVECDCKFECYCPTLERAVQFENIFIHLTMDLFYQFGWAGCAAKDRRQPSEGETPAT